MKHLTESENHELIVDCRKALRAGTHTTCEWYHTDTEDPCVLKQRMQVASCKFLVRTGCEFRIISRGDDGILESPP